MSKSLAGKNHMETAYLKPLMIAINGRSPIINLVIDTELGYLKYLEVGNSNGPNLSSLKAKLIDIQAESVVTTQFEARRNCKIQIECVKYDSWHKYTCI